MNEKLLDVPSRRYRAPIQDGSALFEPSFSGSLALAGANRLESASLRRNFLERPFLELRREARSSLVRAAIQYSSAYRDVEFPVALDSNAAVEAPFVLAGHQPHLFHPGVWLKNFALARLGRELGAWAINLLVDNDTLRQPSVLVPRRDGTRIWQVPVPFDGTAPEMPYEERRLVDSGLFDSFGARVAEQIRPLVERPVIADYWPLACEATRTNRNLGECLAQARHRLEAQWGLQTLEVPLSTVCEQPSYWWFAGSLLADAENLRRVYNEALAGYRRANHLRSRSHPAPDLERDGEWIEVPFWLWTAERPQRRRAFVGTTPQGLVLTDRRGWQMPLRDAAAKSPESLVERLQGLASQGIKVRPRALMTTAYARLFLSDLFVHGIGGGMYDQVTDELLARYFGIQHLGFMVVTATIRLPVPLGDATLDDLRHAERALRETWYQPERHAGQDPTVRQLAEEKRRWIEILPPRGQRRDRHVAIQRLNDSLQPYVAEPRQRWERELQRLKEELRGARLLGSREYAFCLFPEASLRPTLLALANNAS